MILHVLVFIIIITLPDITVQLGVCNDAKLFFDLTHLQYILGVDRSHFPLTYMQHVLVVSALSN